MIALDQFYLRISSIGTEKERDVGEDHLTHDGQPLNLTCHATDLTRTCVAKVADGRHATTLRLNTECFVGPSSGWAASTGLRTSSICLK